VIKRRIDVGLRFALTATLTALFLSFATAGQAATISSDPDPLDFGNIKLGERAELTFEIFPVIDDPSTFLDVWLSIDVSGFWVVSQETAFGGSCVGSFDNCLITVGFQPNTVGQYVGSVSATDLPRDFSSIWN
jgi:hypothetical protein